MLLTSFRHALCLWKSAPALLLVLGGCASTAAVDTELSSDPAASLTAPETEISTPEEPEVAEPTPAARPATRPTTTTPAQPKALASTAALSAKKLLALDSNGIYSDDQFGWSVAVSGEVVVAGAPFDDSNATNAGAVYLYGRNQGGSNNWGLIKRLTLPSEAAVQPLGSQFGFAVALSGDTLAVGANRLNAPQAGGNITLQSAGGVYLFQRDRGGANNWGLVKRLTPTSAQANDEFGRAVALSANTLLVGTPQDASRSGTAYVFERNLGGTDNWGESRQLSAVDLGLDARFGLAVALSGDTAVVGAPLADPNGIADGGRAFVFARNQGGGGNWGQISELTPPSSAARDTSDNFGFAVAIAGDAAAAGAPGDDQGSGSVHIFTRESNNSWMWQRRQLAAPSPLDLFGQSLAISSNSMVVGARWDDNQGTDSGSAFRFERNAEGSNRWGFMGLVSPGTLQPGDEYGSAAATDGASLVVSAPKDDSRAAKAGAVYIFYGEPLPPPAIFQDGFE